MKTPTVSSATSSRRGQISLRSPTPRLPRSSVCSMQDLANPSAFVHPKRFSTPSLTLKVLCAGNLNRRKVMERSNRFITRFGAASVFLARFTAVVRAFVPLIAGILRMSPLQFYVANILSALVWAPAHVFPGVLLATALKLAGATAEQLTVLIIAGLIVVLTVVWTMRLASAHS